MLVTERSTPRTSGIILAGGRSSRFGSHKALAEVRREPIITTMWRILEACCDEVIVAVDTPETEKRLRQHVQARYVIDGGKGPYGAIARCVQETEAERVVVVPCDMPYIGREDVMRLLHSLDRTDIATYLVDGWMTTLFLAARKKTVGMGRADLPVMELFRGARRVRLHRMEKIGQLANMNTMEDQQQLMMRGEVRSEVVEIIDIDENNERVWEEIPHMRKYLARRK